MITINKPLKRLRIITPAFPFPNIFTRSAKKIPSLGPVIVATMANKLPGWAVEIIDENGWRGPKKADGAVDHQQLQKEAPADAVAFYGGLSSTMPRAWELAQFYKSQEVITIAGGLHVSYLSEESLANNIDIVIKGDAEIAIQQILLQIENGQKPAGIIQGQTANLDNLPFPDFGLIRNMKIKIYPISRIRGCSRKCEFCSINCSPRWASAVCLLKQIDWLVETRQAKKFMIVDDRISEDRDGYLEFFLLVAKKYGRRLQFTVQSSLETIKDGEFIEAMRTANVKHVCIGLESPIKEELSDMQKANKAAEMVKLARQWCKLFLVHGMFIFGYPPKKKSTEKITHETRIKAYKKFIRQSRLHSIQILRPVPLVGSKLRQRLEESGQLVDLRQAGWEYYDGNFALFQPENMTFAELQQGPSQLMSWFYSAWGWLTVPSRTLTMPFHYLINLSFTWSPYRAWSIWHKGWWIDIVRLGAHILIKGKQKKEEEKFLRSLRSFKNTKNP